MSGDGTESAESIIAGIERAGIVRAEERRVETRAVLRVVAHAGDDLPVAVQRLIPRRIERQRFLAPAVHGDARIGMQRRVRVHRKPIAHEPRRFGAAIRARIGQLHVADGGELVRIGQIAGLIVDLHAAFEHRRLVQHPAQAAERGIGVLFGVADAAEAVPRRSGSMMSCDRLPPKPSVSAALSGRVCSRPIAVA